MVEKRVDLFQLPLRPASADAVVAGGRALAAQPTLFRPDAGAAVDPALADEALHQVLAERVRHPAPLTKEHLERVTALLSVSAGDLCMHDTLCLGGLEKPARDVSGGGDTWSQLQAAWQQRSAKSFRTWAKLESFSSEFTDSLKAKSAEVATGEVMRLRAAEVETKCRNARQELALARHRLLQVSSKLSVGVRKGQAVQRELGAIPGRQKQKLRELEEAVETERCAVAHAAKAVLDKNQLRVMYSERLAASEARIDEAGQRAAACKERVTLTRQLVVDALNQQQEFVVHTARRGTGDGRAVRVCGGGRAQLAGGATTREDHAARVGAEACAHGIDNGGIDNGGIGDGGICDGGIGDGGIGDGGIGDGGIGDGGIGDGDRGAAACENGQREFKEKQQGEARGEELKGGALKVGESAEPELEHYAALMTRLYAKAQKARQRASNYRAQFADCRARELRMRSELDILEREIASLRRRLDTALQAAASAASGAATGATSSQAHKDAAAARLECAAHERAAASTDAARTHSEKQADEKEMSHTHAAAAELGDSGWRAGELATEQLALSDSTLDVQSAQLAAARMDLAVALSALRQHQVVSDITTASTIFQGSFFPDTLEVFGRTLDLSNTQELRCKLVDIDRVHEAEREAWSFRDMQAVRDARQLRGVLSAERPSGKTRHARKEARRSSRHRPGSGSGSPPRAPPRAPPCTPSRTSSSTSPSTSPCTSSRTSPDALPGSPSSEASARTARRAGPALVSATVWAGPGVRVSDMMPQSVYFPDVIDESARDLDSSDTEHTTCSTGTGTGTDTGTDVDTGTDTDTSTDTDSDTGTSPDELEGGSDSRWSITRHSARVASASRDWTAYSA